MDVMMERLYDKDTSIAYQYLQELERISEENDSLYPFLERFYEMISNEKYVIRVRGFRLFCKQAKWDAQNQLDERMTSAMVILNDEKPTAVRQALKALEDVAKHKPVLANVMREHVRAIDYMQYKDSMQGLIKKDIDRLLAML
ncbi:MAG: hypothetical protein GX096_04620 [Clostridiales bacterium]|nr:hypothetical protein [Clostridiales bacterium]